MSREFSEFKDHFSGHAADYAEYRPVYPPVLAEVLAERTPARALAVDCGCGSGQLSVLLAAHFDQVIGTDASAEQIANAAPHPRVRYRAVPAERTGLADRCADLMVAAQAAHWFDLPAFWREAGRVVRPGGLVALVAYVLFRVDERIDPLLTRFHDVILKPHWPPERWSVAGGYADVALPFPEVEAPQDLEMTVQWTLGQLLNYVSTWSSVKRAERSLDASPTLALARELRPLWGDPERPRCVRWPLRLRLGRVGGI